MGYRYEKPNISQIRLDHRPWPVHPRHKQFLVCPRCGATGVPRILYANINGVVMAQRHTWVWPGGLPVDFVPPFRLRLLSGRKVQHPCRSKRVSTPRTEPSTIMAAAAWWEHAYMYALPGWWGNPSAIRAEGSSGQTIPRNGQPVRIRPAAKPPLWPL